MSNVADLLQWPAMVVTVVASWWVASTHRRKRVIGFWTFLLSNALWIAWGLHARANALVVLQLFLAILNVRGFWKAGGHDHSDGAAAGGTDAPR
jgi:hypothetical protein